MFKIWIIAQRELQSFFDSLMAYILLVLFLGFSGLFTWLYGADVFISGQASLRSFFSIAYWTLFFFIPALTMKSLAEERKTGTIELLLTKAVTDRQVILGKFLSIIMLIAIALVFTLPYYLTVASIGPIDHGATLLGYVGLLLMSATYISLGIYTSSLTNNQIVAFLLSIFIGLLFHLVFDVLAANFTGIVGELLATLSLSTHFESISRGVMDSKDLVYFISFITLCLFLAEISLAKRNVIK
jgi:ABC-2 type transport system permease protein